MTGQDEDEVLEAVRSMARIRQTDGFILLYSRQNDPVIEYLHREKLPMY